MTDQYRIIGRLEAQQAATDERLERIEHSNERTESMVTDIKSYIDQQKGGWKVIWAVASAGGVIGASLVKIASMLKGGQ